VLGTASGFLGPIRSAMPLLERGRLLVGLYGVLQGLDLAASSLQHPLRVSRREIATAALGLGGSIVELLEPLLGGLDPLSCPLCLAAKLIVHGRLRVVAVLGELTTTHKLEASLPAQRVTIRSAHPAAG